MFEDFEDLGVIGRLTSPLRRRLTPNGSDHFQTPPWALAPILDYLNPEWKIWEPAAGEGNMVRTLQARGHRVWGTDLESGYDFLRWQPPAHLWDCIVTNPPYSLKDEFIARCYRLGKPFALLLPIAALGEQRRMALYREHGVQVILPHERINFETPSGEGSGAWFFSAWFLGYFGLPSDLIFWTPPSSQGTLPGME